MNCLRFLEAHTNWLDHYDPIRQNADKDYIQQKCIEVTSHVENLMKKNEAKSTVPLTPELRIKCKEMSVQFQALQLSAQMCGANEVKLPQVLFVPITMKLADAPKILQGFEGSPEGIVIPPEEVEALISPVMYAAKLEIKDISSEEFYARIWKYIVYFYYRLFCEETTD